jgi:hypothetical protein
MTCIKTLKMTLFVPFGYTCLRMSVYSWVDVGVQPSRTLCDTNLQIV